MKETIKAMTSNVPARQPSNSEHRTTGCFRHLFLAAGTLIILGGCGHPGTDQNSAALPIVQLQAQNLPATASEPDANLIDDSGLDIAERRVIGVYKRISPAVVNITTQVLARTFFYGVIPQEGAGSGFVLDKEGHILTNFHVIKGAQQIEVAFGDETAWPARLVGTDPRNDIAVLQVDTPKEALVPVTLGASNDLQVGQRAIAIGNPFGEFSRTLTTGVISALNRTIEGPEKLGISGIIQTDAAINRGNSGGPLLDSSGRVIGMNTAIFSPSGNNVGIGFAIPVDTIRRVLPDLLALGHYRHPWLGIRYAYAISSGLAKTIDLPVNEGLLLVQVFQDSPLMKTDIRGAQQEVIRGNRRFFVGGDILTKIDDMPISNLDQLRLYLESNHQVGDEVHITLLRNGQERTITVPLAEEPNR